MYGITVLLDKVELSAGSHEICSFECLNCKAKIRKEYRHKDKKHRCSSFRKNGQDDEKWCFKCQEWLDVAFFQRAKSVSGGYSKACRSCRQKYMKKAENKRQKKARSHYEETGTLPSLKLRSLISSAKTRANKYDLHIDIDAEFVNKLWIEQKGKCYYTEVPMQWAKQRVSFYSPSIDRLDPDKGYTRDNVVLCLFAINSFKQDLSATQFIELVNNVSWRKSL